MSTTKLLSLMHTSKLLPTTSLYCALLVSFLLLSNFFLILVHITSSIFLMAAKFLCILSINKDLISSSISIKGKDLELTIKALNTLHILLSTMPVHVMVPIKASQNLCGSLAMKQHV
ncbi:hypothetical protein MANES_10G071401v8 [Manihot esculenta]|uniref:Uncharacterized protein n=1 Tax=Manihot esculenta TaxID=3983 RepID=A0ACB7H0Y7_MANES|nr:hypothetical protein MANES_10G071401v8 [Manihot esculenta]